MSPRIILWRWVAVSSCAPHPAHTVGGSWAPCHPISPYITPNHPVSPHITPCHPTTSPPITPCHPLSPRITPHRPTSPPRLLAALPPFSPHLPGDEQELSAGTQLQVHKSRQWFGASLLSHGGALLVGAGGRGARCHGGAGAHPEPPPPAGLRPAAALERRARAQRGVPHPGGRVLRERRGAARPGLDLAVPRRAHGRLVPGDAVR